jgi:hypothetical protein
MYSQLEANLSDRYGDLSKRGQCRQLTFQCWHREYLAYRTISNTFLPLDLTSNRWIAASYSD